MRKVIIITLFFFSSYLKGSALTLDEALINAYKTNPDLNAQRESLKASDEQIMTALNGWLPTVAMSASKQSITAQKATIKTSPNTTSIGTSVSEGVTNKLVISQNLFRGGGDIASLRAASASIEQARAALENKEQDIFLKTVDAYLSVIRAKDRYHIFQEQERDNTRLVDGMTHRFRAGEINRIDLEFARANLANFKSQTIVAYANYEAAKATFQAVVGLDPKDLTLPEDNINLPKSINEVVDIALVKNPNIIAVKNTVKANEHNINVARAGVLPSINLEHEISDRTKFSPSADPRRSHTTLLSVSVPIFGSTNGEGKERWSNLRATKRTAAAAKNTLNSTIYSVQAGAIQAWETLQAQRKNLLNAQDAFKSMQVAYRGALASEKAGLISVVELITQFGDQYFELSKKLVDAKVDYRTALYSLKSVVGECTAKGLKLNVPYYDPLKNYNSIKWQLIGAF
jgi:outer membrane protein